jgi:hypothetical protein
MKARHAALSVLLAGHLVAGATLHAQGRGKGKHDAKHDDVKHEAVSGTQTQIHVVFSTHDATVIREHYRPQYRNLPPGLQKKYNRTGQLPPGWQKKMTPMPVALERRLEPLPTGYHRGVFEGHAVIYKPGGLIIDATVLF